MHTIRLRHPWDKKLVGQDTSVRVDVPESVGDEQQAGLSYLYTRRFNRPTGLDHSASVRLCVTGWLGHFDSLSINGHSIDITDAPIAIDVAPLLQRQNEILIQLTATTKEPASLTGQVTLQIAP